MFLGHVFQKYDLSAGARGANSHKPLAGHDQHYIPGQGSVEVKVQGNL